MPKSYFLGILKQGKFSLWFVSEVSKLIKSFLQPCTVIQCFQQYSIDSKEKLMLENGKRYFGPILSKTFQMSNVRLQQEDIKQSIRSNDQE